MQNEKKKVIGTCSSYKTARRAGHSCLLEVVDTYTCITLTETKVIRGCGMGGATPPLTRGLKCTCTRPDMMTRLFFRPYRILEALISVKSVGAATRLYTKYIIWQEDRSSASGRDLMMMRCSTLILELPGGTLIIPLLSYAYFFFVTNRTTAVT